MGHNLNSNGGKIAMMYVGEVPWHKLGTKLNLPATAAEAIEAAGLGFTVEKVPLVTESLQLPVPGHFATVRADTQDVLGVVGANYTPIQNKDAFTTFDSLVGTGEAIYHTAGVLGKGERIWLLAKLPEYIRVNGDDLVEKFLLLTNSHDGSGAVRVKLTPIRVVCENTLSLALGGSEEEVRIRHTPSAHVRLEKAHEILGLTNKLYTQLEEIFNGMSRTPVNGKTLGNYVNSVFPLQRNGEGTRALTRRMHDKVLELAEVGLGAEACRGTLWGAYNAVTELVDHYRQPLAEDSTRLKSIWFGSGERIKKEAFRVAVGMMN